MAAKNARIGLLQSQLNEVAKQIAELKNKPPGTIVRTVPVGVPKIIEVERKKSGADFAIVTDPAQTGQAGELERIRKAARRCNS